MPSWAVFGFGANRARVLFISAVIVFSAILSGAAVGALLLDRPQTQRRAVIVDQLGLTDPNPVFLHDVAASLTSAGYQIDYVDYRAVSVELLRRLPERKYSLIIIRSHSALSSREAPESISQAETLSLFTTEAYAKDRHVADQYLGAVDRVRLVSSEHDRAFFGVTDGFVRNVMVGKLDDADVILMGCDSMRSLSMAVALQYRGARSIIGWDGPVSAQHTDRVTSRIIELVAREDYDAGSAARRAMVELGTDPDHHSQLVAYP